MPMPVFAPLGVFRRTLTTILGHEQRLDAIPSFLMNGPAADQMRRRHESVDYLVDRCIGPATFAPAQISRKP